MSNFDLQFPSGAQGGVHEEDAAGGGAVHLPGTLQRRGRHEERAGVRRGVVRFHGTTS